jgi:hypothetical protein
MTGQGSWSNYVAAASVPYAAIQCSENLGYIPDRAAISLATKTDLPRTIPTQATKNIHSIF